MFKAIIFDFDGVIWDTYEMNYTLSKLFDPNITRQDFEDHHNGNVWAEPKIKISMDEVKILFEKQREIFTKNHLFPVKEILEKYAKESQIFILSSSSEKNIWDFLHLWEYDAYFTQILWVDTHKSKVEKFKIIFNKYNLLPKDCIFVTDTIGDIKEARHFDIVTIAVTWWYHPRKLLESENPNKIVENTQELEWVLEYLYKANGN